MGSTVATRSVLGVGRKGDEPVPGYRLLERIGFGGSGEVWRAEAPGGLVVAIKLIRIAGKLGRRELNNLRILRAIRHPNLLAYFGAWTTDDSLTIGMELADRSLWDRWRELSGQGLAGIPMTELLETMGEAAGVIDFLHEPRHELDGMTGVAIHHRDIKPQNLLLLGRGVKVADFGLSTMVDQNPTSPSHPGLTYPYAAPETFRGQVTDQSDQYSLAVTYCVLRGGRPPFTGPAAAVMHGHLFQEPDLTMLPEPERPVVARALAKDPLARWADCRGFIEALQTCPAAGSPETIPLPFDSEDEQAPKQPSSAFVLEQLNSEVPTGLLDESAWEDEPSAYQVDSPGLGQFSSAAKEEPGSSGAILAADPGQPDREWTEPYRRTLKPLGWRGAACLLAAGCVAWGMLMVGASARLQDRPRKGNHAVPGWSGDLTEPAAPTSPGEPVLSLLSVPPDPLGPVSKTSTPSPDSPPMAANLSGDRAPAIPGPVGPAGETIDRRPGLAPHAQAQVSEFGVQATRIIRLASAGVEAVRAQAGQIVRVAREALAARAAGRTTPAGAASPTAVARAQAKRDEAPLPLCLELPVALEVDAGRSKPVPIVASRGRATGPITVRFEGLPAGISLPPVGIPAQSDRAQARVQADAGASHAQAKVRVTASAGSERAEGSITLIVRDNPSLAFRVQGDALLAVGKPSEAIAAFSRALALGSPDSIILNNRGLAYTLLGQSEAAIADYSAAIRLNPNDPVIRFNRGASHARRGETLHAELDFDAAIRLNPGYISAYRSRAKLHERRGDAARAAVDRARANTLEQEAVPKGKLRSSPSFAVTPSSPSAIYRAWTTIDPAAGS